MRNAGAIPQLLGSEMRCVDIGFESTVTASYERVLILDLIIFLTNQSIPSLIWSGAMRVSSQSEVLLVRHNCGENIDREGAKSEAVFFFWMIIFSLFCSLSRFTILHILLTHTTSEIKPSNLFALGGV